MLSLYRRSECATIHFEICRRPLPRSSSSLPRLNNITGHTCMLCLEMRSTSGLRVSWAVMCPRDIAWSASTSAFPYSMSVEQGGEAESRRLGWSPGEIRKLFWQRLLWRSLISPSAFDSDDKRAKAVGVRGELGGVGPYSCARTDLILLLAKSAMFDWYGEKLYGFF